MHVHLPPENVLPLTHHAALLYLAHGITTVREAVKFGRLHAAGMMMSRAPGRHRKSAKARNC